MHNNAAIAVESTQTTCPYCGVGCGVNAADDAAVKGDSTHPANAGRLCVKGSALHETLSLGERLLQPRINGAEADWSTTLDTITERLLRIRNRHGADAIAMYVSGQLLTEDYYVANKFMKGFVGSANIDTNSRLCMASAVVGYKRAFGADAVPGCYEDIDNADLLVLAGSNAAWTHPVLFQRMQANKRKNGCKVVVIDPRRTASCDLADLHLAITPGSDAWLFNGLLAWLYQSGHVDKAYIDRATEGFDGAAKEAAKNAGDLLTVSDQCGISEQEILTFYQWFAKTAKAVTFYSQGVNQSATGVDKNNAIINCHLATGKIGYEGAGPFSVTGQPNAMGGREVGGLANQLAAHMSFDNPADVERVKRFWDAPGMAESEGLKAVDMFDAIEDGRIRAVWIMATNPMVSMPDNNRLKKALADCELVIVSDCVANNDTLAYADIVLPAAGWGEKDGTVTNSERCISRQRAFLPLPGRAKPDWWAICQVARRMGHGEAFAYRHPAEIFAEHAALSAFENNGSRDFDLGGLMHITPEAYDKLAPIQWPVNKHYPNGCKRLFSDAHFYTATGKAQFVAITPQMPKAVASKNTPFVLNTGRVRDQWHTMTRTAKSRRLLQHISEPFCDINPQDAGRLGVQGGDIVRVYNERGHLLLRAVINEGQQPGQVFVPIHWNDQYAAAASVDSVVGSVVDPLSGQPEFKHSCVAIEPFAAQTYGLLLSREPLTLPTGDYWARSPFDNGCLTFFASEKSVPQCMETLAQGMAPENVMQYRDEADGDWRMLEVTEGRAAQLISLSAKSAALDANRLVELFGKSELAQKDWLELLAGKSAGDLPPQGNIVCACFQVGDIAINAAISEGCKSVEALGEKLQCGSNCGSCIPELKQLLAGDA